MNISKAVGKLMPLLLLGAIAIGVNGQTGDEPITREEIIAKAWKAMFGERSNKDIQSIYEEGYFHGRTVPSRMTVRRPNLFRNENPSGVLVFDGTRAAWAKTIFSPLFYRERDRSTFSSALFYGSGEKDGIPIHVKSPDIQMILPGIDTGYDIEPARPYIIPRQGVFAAAIVIERIKGLRRFPDHGFDTDDLV